MKIYVASSWRNPEQPEMVRLLKEAGNEVYDFRNPAPGEKGFSWSEIDPNWKNWTPEQFRHALDHPIALHGYSRDYEALKWCDSCLMMMPSGLSAHLEVGWAAGAGKHTAVYLPSLKEPELMYNLLRPHADERIFPTMEKVLIHYEYLNTWVRQHHENDGEKVPSSS